MPRKGENIRKRKDGRWEGRYSAAAPGAQKKQHSVYARTYKEVKEKLINAKQAARQAEQLLHTQPLECCVQAPFGEVAQAWLEEISKTRKQATFVKYRTILKKYLLGPFHGRFISQLGPDCLEGAVFTKGATFSESLTRSIYCVMEQILRYGAKRYHSPSMPLQKELPKGGKKRVEVFSQAEQRRLFGKLYEGASADKVGVLLSLTVGLRLGEVCALKWEDIDLEAGLLYVNRTVQRIWVGGQGGRTRLVEGEPKTAASKREIPLSDGMVRLLRSLRGESGARGGYVLKGHGPLEPRTCLNRFKKLLAQAGVRLRSFHVLRHTFATNCVEGGVDAKSLSEILGHSNTHTTLNRYVHPSRDMKRRQMNAMSAVYGQYLGQGVCEAPGSAKKGGTFRRLV